MTSEIFSQKEFKIRLARVRAEMEQHGFDCLYLPYGPNQYYLTGLNAKPTSRAASRVLAALIPSKGEIMFVAPAGRRKLIEKASWVKTIRTWTFPNDDPEDVVAKALCDLSVDKGVIGVDPATPYREVETIRRLLSEATFQSCSGIFDTMRRIKSDEETSQLRQAAAIADRSLETGLAQLRVGVAEAEIASAIYSSILYDEGSISLVAVIAGKHTGFPEQTTQRHVQRDQLVMMFPKFSYNGYFVDITRVAVVGEPSEEEKAIEEAIMESHAAAVTTARPGVTYDEVDRAARRVLEEHGFAKYFTHEIGHGLGLETHESPFVGTNTVLEAGMVFTIEPAVYRPGRPAMRIEDTFVVTADGCERLTQLPIGIFIS